MDSQIETWRVVQFGQGVYHLSQQKESLLAPRGIRKESFTGKAEFFDRLGLATAQDKVGRNSDTPNLSIEHSRRMVTTITREWGTLVDRKDKVQNIQNPENEYQIAAKAAHGRKMDEVLRDAAFGTARAGEDGSTSVVLPNAQKITAVASGAIDYANVQLLRKAKRTLDEAEVKGKRYLFHAADFLEALLQSTVVTSSDYNTVKALVQGELNTFLGFEFVPCERLGGEALATTYDGATYKYNTTTGLYDSGGTVLGATDKTALVYVEGALIMGMNPNFISRVDERNDKSYSAQVYMAMDYGAVRMEDEKVLQLIYKA